MAVHKREKGYIIIFVAVLMTVLMGLAALAVDTGMMSINKSELQNACDAAALAGVQELSSGPEQAVLSAKQYAMANGVDEKNISVEIIDGCKVKVTGKKSVSYIFAKVFGLSSGTVEAKALAAAEAIKTINKGLRPFGVVEPNGGFQFGEEIILKDGAGNASNGNYGALALDGNGAKDYEDDIVNGSNCQYSVGDSVSTKPGNMAGKTVSGVNALINKCTHYPKCTYNSYQEGCPKLITIPVVDSMDVNGRKSVKILGFACFFIEKVNEDKSGKGHAQITGRFIKKVVDGETDSSLKDYGLHGIKLAE